MIVSLDLAEKAGVAWMRDDNSDTIYVKEIRGTPEQQYDMVQRIIWPETNISIVLEKFVYFTRSVKTQYDIIKRIVIVEYLLSKDGHTVTQLHPQTVRAKYFKGTDKKKRILEYFRDNYEPELTDNHTDALLMLLYYMNIPLNAPFNIKITQGL